jgi:hypothetical protein
VASSSNIGSSSTTYISGPGFCRDWAALLELLIWLLFGRQVTTRQPKAQASLCKHDQAAGRMMLVPFEIGQIHVAHRFCFP